VSRGAVDFETKVGEPLPQGLGSGLEPGVPLADAHGLGTARVAGQQGRQHVIAAAMGNAQHEPDVARIHVASDRLGQLADDADEHLGMAPPEDHDGSTVVAHRGSCGHTAAGAGVQLPGRIAPQPVTAALGIHALLGARA
jgi:hypothetical protein